MKLIDAQRDSVLIDRDGDVWFRCGEGVKVVTRPSTGVEVTHYPLRDLREAEECFGPFRQIHPVLDEPDVEEEPLLCANCGAEESDFEDTVFEGTPYCPDC